MTDHCVQQTLSVSACSPDNNGNVLFSIQCHNFGAVPFEIGVYVGVCMCLGAVHTCLCIFSLCYIILLL